jgi:hypothetical protein
MLNCPNFRLVVLNLLVLLCGALLYSTLLSMTSKPYIYIYMEVIKLQWGHRELTCLQSLLTRQIWRNRTESCKQTLKTEGIELLKEQYLYKKKRLILLIYASSAVPWSAVPLIIVIPAWPWSYFVYYVWIIINLFLSYNIIYDTLDFAFWSFVISTLHYPWDLWVILLYLTPDYFTHQV